MNPLWPPNWGGIWRSAFSVINVKKIYIIVTKNKTKLLPECVWELRLEGELRCPLGLWREDNIFLIMNRTRQNTFFVILLSSLNALELLIGNLAAQNPTHLTGLSRWAALSAGPKVNQTAFSGAKYRLGRKFTVCIVYGLKTTHAWLWTSYFRRVYEKIDDDAFCNLWITF